MRFLPLCAVAILAGFPTITVLSAAETPAATPADPSVPKANVALIDKSLTVTGPLITGSETKLDLAKKSALLPFAGATVKAKVDEAQADVVAAKGLHADLTNLRAGKKADPNGLLAQMAAGKPGVTSDRFKDIPGASKVTTFLATPGLAQAITSNLPVDKIPGYAKAMEVLNAK